MANGDPTRDPSPPTDGPGTAADPTRSEVVEPTAGGRDPDATRSGGGSGGACPAGGDTVARLAWVDGVCDRFDALCRAGDAPSVGAFLRAEGVDPAAAPPDLLRELARVEAEYRRAAPVVPGYEILEEVGSGGMGDVYRARELAFDRDVAVKLLQSRYPANSPSARRFVDEARITGQLQHPGIPPVHHVGTLPDGRPFLAMKLIKGDTLADLLVTEPQNRGRFVAVFAQVCQAVGYAHSRGVLHRDLKPSNVMVGAFGEVQVVDWGLAKVLTDRPESAEPAALEDERTEVRTLRDAAEATQAGSVLGTPSFMAPEQAGGEVEKVDERSDVFGLGAVLCAILTGRPPYAAPDSDSVRLMAIRGETADALARLDACDADPELVALCKRCLAARRDERPRDAGEVARAVAAHLAAAEERARRAELDRVRAEERRKRRRTQFALAGAVALLLAVVAFGAGVAHLWRAAEDAKNQLASSNDQLGQANQQLGDEKKRTELARDEAVRQQGVAEKAQAAEEEARKKLAVFEYGRTMQVAHQEWRDNNVAAAVALLNSTRRDLRGWEWHYVHRLCHSELLTLKGHTGDVTFASWSPDGSRVVTGSNDLTARVWDAKTGAELLTLKGHTALVASASFSPDGSRIVTGCYDNTARVWDTKTGAELLTLRGHTGAVTFASWSPDGSRVLTGGGDNTARVWDSRPLRDTRPPDPELAPPPRPVGK